MKSLANFADFPVSTPLVSDDILETHAARLLLLLRFSGRAGRIEGLTKLAKLDFFVRYPAFFQRVAFPDATTLDLDQQIESTMVRHHYGPWDKRYYHVLGWLEARGLVEISKVGNAFKFQLTDDGNKAVRALNATGDYAHIVEQMTSVKSAFGGYSGSRLKQLIYDTFTEDVKNRPLGTVIGR